MMPTRSSCLLLNFLRSAVDADASSSTCPTFLFLQLSIRPHTDHQSFIFLKERALFRGERWWPSHVVLRLGVVADVGLLPAAEGPWLVLRGMCARMGLYIQPAAEADPIGCSYRDFIVSALDTNPSLGTLVFKRLGGSEMIQRENTWRLKGKYKCGGSCRMNERPQSDDRL